MKPRSKKRSKPKPKRNPTTAKRVRRRIVRYRPEPEWIGTDCAAAGERMRGCYVDD